MTITERAQRAREEYNERLRTRVVQLCYAELPCLVSQRDHDEILTEVIEGALLELLTAWQRVALHSGLSDGQAAAELIEREIGRRTEETLPSHDANFPRTRALEKRVTTARTDRLAHRQIRVK